MKTFNCICKITTQKITIVQTSPCDYEFFFSGERVFFCPFCGKELGASSIRHTTELDKGILESQMLQPADVLEDDKESLSILFDIIPF